MGAILLDTTILIDALRGRDAERRILSLRASGDTPFTSPINVEEVVRGLRPSDLEGATRLFDGLHIAELGRLEGEQAGQWRREFAKRGRTLAQADCLIAAASLRVGGRLATGNPKDFPMREISVEHWPVGT